jgi:hypothetical protein
MTADFSESNFWQTTASMPTGTIGDLPARADVAVIGAGVHRSLCRPNSRKTRC